MVTNRSYDTDGLDDPTQDWLQRVVRVIKHPEWGPARVLRWYPSVAGNAQMLRIKAQNKAAPQLVSILEVEVISEG